MAPGYGRRLWSLIVLVRRPRPSSSTLSPLSPPSIDYEDEDEGRGRSGKMRVTITGGHTPERARIHLNGRARQLRGFPPPSLVSILVFGRRMVSVSPDRSAEPSPQRDPRCRLGSLGGQRADSEQDGADAQRRGWGGGKAATHHALGESGTSLLDHEGVSEWEKETGPFSRNGLKGASQKRVLSPFPILREGASCDLYPLPHGGVLNSFCCGKPFSAELVRDSH